MRLRIGVTIGVVCLLTACASTPRGTGLGPLHRLGEADWSSATTATPTARVLTVSADVSTLAPETGCPTVTAAATAHETSRTITISVEALSRDYLGPDVCAGSGYLTVSATVHLSAPVGHRTPIDARDGSEHAVLARSTIPTLSSLPPGFTRRGAGWDESSGVIHEWWRHSPQPAQIDLWEYPATSTRAVPTLPEDVMPVTIAKTSGRAASEWLPPDTQEYFLRWAPSGGDAASPHGHRPAEAADDGLAGARARALSPLSSGPAFGSPDRQHADRPIRLTPSRGCRISRHRRPSSAAAEPCAVGCGSVVATPTARSSRARGRPR